MKKPVEHKFEDLKRLVDTPDTPELKDKAVIDDNVQSANDNLPKVIRSKEEAARFEAELKAAIAQSGEWRVFEFRMTNF